MMPSFNVISRRSLLTVHYCESSKTLEGDVGKDRVHYAAIPHHFKKSTPEIVLSSKNYKKVKMKEGL